MSSERRRPAPPIVPGTARWLGNALIGRYGKRQGDAPLPVWVRVLERFGVPAFSTTVLLALAAWVARQLGATPCP